LPFFIIVGTQKGGTATLYRYLCRHSQISPAIRKEVHYFDLNYDRGIDWYKAFFPYTRELQKKEAITGEASPLYMYLKEVPNRIKKDLPEVKLIVLLRNPIDRAISHFEFYRAKGIEHRSQEEYLNEFNYSINSMVEFEKKLKNTNDKRSLSYVTRGLYSEQLERIFDKFDRDNLKIVVSEELFTHPQENVKSLFKFLNLEIEDIGIAPRANYNKKKKVNSDLYKILQDYYSEEIQKISRLGLNISAWKND
jgi:hypothetical protein